MWQRGAPSGMKWMEVLRANERWGLKEDLARAKLLRLAPELELKAGNS